MMMETTLKPMFKREVMFVTPEIALLWLEKNAVNRALKRRQVARFANIIRSGGWRTTHQGVAFYKDGNLADGQHRLHAIVATGMGQWIEVTTGLDREDCLAIDLHTPRSMSDVARLSGADKWIDRNSIAVIKFLLEVRERRIYDISEILEFADQYADGIRFCIASFTTSKRRLTPASIKAAIAVAFYSEPDKDRLDMAAKIIISGIADNPDQVAIIRLREFLLNMQGGYGHAERVSAYLRAQRAIKSFMNHEPLSRLCEPASAIYTLPELPRLADAA